MKIGASKVDITPNIKGIAMLGFGIPDHTVEGESTKLFSRAFYIQSNEKAIGIVVAEIAFFTPSLRYKILEILKDKYSELKLNPEDILLTAQHTHSAPGGYSYHPFYNITTPGLRKSVLKSYSENIAKSLYLAFKNLEEGDIKLGKGVIDANEKVSFNRSIAAYNRNKDVEPITQETSHLGVNREMTLMQFVNKDGKPIGSINWFAVHTTSIPNTLNKIHSDNKGYAALYLEDEHSKNNPNYVGAFAHGNSGDVTPNFVFDKSGKYNRLWNGPYPEHDRNALFNGRIQYKKALEIEKEIESKKAIESSEIDSYLIWKDMSHLDIDSKYADGEAEALTSSSCLGVAMFMGTRTEGLGFPDPVIPLAKTLSAGVKTYEQAILPFSKKNEKNRLNRKYKAQGVKEIILETGDNRLFGTKDIKNFILPDFADKTVELIKYFSKKGSYDILPLAPQTLPFQVVKIGSIALVAIPFEITTIAGKRLQKLLEDKLLSDTIEHIILCPYSNAYNGYITTFEEYQEQEYEGGHNVFGQWSLAATKQICADLINEFKKPKEERNYPSDNIKFPDESQMHLLEY